MRDKTHKITVSRHAPLLLIVGLLTLAIPTERAEAQVIANTFGPGMSYDRESGWAVSRLPDAFSSVATPFQYSGSQSVALDRIRVALGTVHDITYTVEIRRGSSMNDATLLESWTRSVVGQGAVPNGASSQIFTFFSGGGLNLSSTETYWIALSGIGIDFGGWQQNDQDFRGLVRFIDQTSSVWRGNDRTTLPAFDVTVQSAVVPEPVTAVLLAGGLFALGITARLRTGRQRES